MSTALPRIRVALFALLAPLGVARGAAAQVVETPALHGFAALDQSLGRGGLISAMGPAGRELLVGANDYWMSLRYDSARAQYQQIFVSQSYRTQPFTQVYLRGLAIADVVGDSALEVVVGVDDGRIYVYDFATKAELLHFQVPVSFSLDGLAACDVSGDAQAEIVVTDVAGLEVYSGSGALLWNVAGVGGEHIVAGAFDADPAREIVTSAGFVIDAGTQTVQWLNPDGGGVDIERADIDSDGLDELLLARAFSDVRAIDIDTQSVKWTIPYGDINAIEVCDVQGDGVLDLLVGAGQFGSVSIYNLSTRALTGAIPLGDWGTNGLHAADLDGDGALEIAWGSGAGWTGPKHLSVAAAATGALEWRSVNLAGPFAGPAMGDIDGDGIDEIVIASARSGDGSGRIVVLDADDLAVRAISQHLADNHSGDNTYAVELYDVDHDGRQEILVGSDQFGSGIIEIFDFVAPATFTRIWTNATKPVGTAFYSIRVADIDGDGDLEVIGGTGATSTAHAGPFVYVYDFTTAIEQWHSPTLGPAGFGKPMRRLFVGDTDGDGTQEIAVLRQGGDVYVVDSASHAIEATLPGPFLSLDVARTSLLATAPSTFATADAAGMVRLHQQVGSNLVSYASGTLATTPIDGVRWHYRRSTWLTTEGRIELHRGLGPQPILRSLPYGYVMNDPLSVLRSPVPRAYACTNTALLEF